MKSPISVSAALLALLVGCSTSDGPDPIATDVPDVNADDLSAPPADVVIVEDEGPPPDEGIPEGDAEVVASEPLVVPYDEHCDNLNPRFCGLPWPSDRWVVPDEATVSGVRLNYDPLAVPGGTESFDVSFYNRLDGFSPSSQIVTLFDEPADLSGAAGPDDIAASLAADHPTVILDLQTGERVPHWVENDARAQSPEETLLYLRPASRLAPGRAYAVAIRGLSGQSGMPIAPSELFVAYRDGLPLAEPALEARRAGMTPVFAALEAAGMERSGLISAWRFVTASDQSTRGTLMAMRAAALEALGNDGLGCTVTSVEEDFAKTGARRVRGTFTVPWFMTAPVTPAALVRDEAGLPILQGTEEVGFTLIVPASLLASDTPGPLITWGHGLFGEAEGTVSGKELMAAMDASGSVVVGTDWHGMSSKDLPFLATALIDVSKFYMVGENLMQGMINQIALTRTFLGTCREAPELLTPSGTSPIDPTRSHFVGGSQGSILGGTYLTVAPDIERGALIVGGANFSFMIERSIHFATFEAILAPVHKSRLIIGTLMALSQHVWDMGESAAWLGAAAEGLEGVGPKRFVYLIAKNDAQVPNLSSDIAARIAGMSAINGSVRSPWGVPTIEPPVDGSGFIAFDVGDPPNPEGNLSPLADAGGHGSVGFVPAATEMIAHFLETGTILDVCEGPCVFE